MKEHPIIFSGEMVQAILEDRKTQTRRVMKPQPSEAWDSLVWLSGIEKWRAHHPSGSSIPSPASPEWRCPYGVPGDQLWVRETWATPGNYDNIKPSELAASHFTKDQIVYRATEQYGDTYYRWRPSIFMPRWARRITLLVTDVRVERVQNISETDAEAEGVVPTGYVASRPICFVDGELAHTAYRDTFRTLWDSINTKRGYPWADNPWVWAVTFEMVEL